MALILEPSYLLACIIKPPMLLLFRKLSRELDMLLNDLPPPSSHMTLPAKLGPTHKIIPVTVVPPSEGGEPPSCDLRVEGEALQGQVHNLTNKRKQLAGELEGLISQVRCD